MNREVVSSVLTEVGLTRNVGHIEAHAGAKALIKANGEKNLTNGHLIEDSSYD